MVKLLEISGKRVFVLSLQSINKIKYKLWNTPSFLNVSQGKQNWWISISNLVEFCVGKKIYGGNVICTFFLVVHIRIKNLKFKEIVNFAGKHIQNTLTLNFQNSVNKNSSHINIWNPSLNSWVMIEKHSFSWWTCSEIMRPQWTTLHFKICIKCIWDLKSSWQWKCGWLQTVLGWHKCLPGCWTVGFSA